MWAVEYAYIEGWLDQQDDATVAAVFAALELLEQQGPALGRPLVDTIHGATIPNLKELRPASPGGSEVRILFAFDPRRSAVMLLAGDKSQGRKTSERWSGWYRRAIRKAEELYAAHLAALEVRNG